MARGLTPCHDTSPHVMHTWGEGVSYVCPGRLDEAAPASPAPRVGVPTAEPVNEPQIASPGVPVVDLTTLVRDLRAIAATRRADAETMLAAAERLAGSYEHEAGYLEDLAGILEGRRG